MGKRKKELALLSDQLRAIIKSCGRSRYSICKEAEIDASQLCRYMQGTGRLTSDSLDRIGEVLGLELVQR